MKNKKIRILDCTLRDGGYVNNWEFGESNIKKVIENLSNAGVEIVECGILGKTKEVENYTKFSRLEDIERFLPKERGGKIYACMMNYAEKDNFIISDRKESSIDCIRIAFFKPEHTEAIAYARELIEKGYLVFLQAMVTSQYSEIEIEDLIYKVNGCKPYGFSLVDSFGTLYNEDVLNLFHQINSKLDNEILFGFHSHNNKQMAFSNTISFINAGSERNIVVDSTVFGMGRGAGNACTELVADYLNQHYNKQYDIEAIISTYAECLQHIYKEHYWGYSISYLLTSLKDINSAYIWYLSTKGVEETYLIKNILDEIPDNSKYFLDKKVIDSILKSRGLLS